MIAELSETGHKTAEIHYGARGWVAHHNSDLWRLSAPVGGLNGNPIWTAWQMGGAWLCQHLWEHYLFNEDLDFLRDQAYPLMRGAAEFLLDTEGLVVDRSEVPGPRPGMIRTSRADREGFHMLGFAGEDKAAHCDHLFAFGELLLTPLAERWSK